MLVIIILIVIVFILLVIKNNKKEHLTSEEAINNISSVYNSGNMVIQNLKITGKLEVVDPISGKTVIITPGIINLTNDLIIKDLSNNQTMIKPGIIDINNSFSIKDLSNNLTTIKPGSIDTNLYIACTGKGLKTDAPNMTTKITPERIKCTDIKDDKENWYWTLSGDNRNQSAALDLNNWQIRQGPIEGSNLDKKHLRIYDRDLWYDGGPFERKVLTELWSEKGSEQRVHSGFMLRKGGENSEEGRFGSRDGRADRGFIDGEIWLHKTHSRDLRI